MEFCSSCGILLFSHNNSGLCNPCLEISLSFQTAGKECSCDFCTHFCNQSPITLQVEKEDKPKKVKKNEIQREKPKKKNSALPTAHTERKKNSKQKLSEKCKAASPVGDSRTTLSTDNWTTVKVKDYRTSLEFDWSSPLDNSWIPYQEHNWETENDTLTLLTAFVNDYDNDNSAEMDSYQQLQSRAKEPMENCVPEDIRKQWESDQKKYKTQLITHDSTDIIHLVSGKRKKDNGRPFYIGGMDISFIKDNTVDACACLSVVRMPDLTLVYQRMEMIQLTQPYIPGFLAFREVPALEDLYRKMESAAPEFLPDVIMVDGNGILHPRGFGLACQLGVILNVPTIGVAKTLISAQGVVDDETHKAKKQTLSKAGDSFELVSESGTVLGLCLRTHDLAPNPVYISIGHMISLESTTWITLECSKFRIPEPVRKADLDSREYLRQELTEPVEFIHQE